MTSGIGVVVDQKTLRERFNKEPMDVFLDLLRDAGEPITAKKAMDTLIEAGLPKPLVAKQWKSAQKYIIRYHPHVVRPTIRKYQWSEKPVAPDEALGRMLEVLATESPSKVKLRDELSEVIRAGLKAAGGPAVIVERVQTRVQQLSLEVVGRPGDEVKFDPLSHAAIGQSPDVGSPVTIVRPGYSRRTGGQAEIIEKALVARE